MLIAVHRAQQRIEKERAKFEKAYFGAVFKNEADHKNQTLMRLRNLPNIVRRHGLNPRLSYVIILIKDLNCLKILFCSLKILF